MQFWIVLLLLACNQQVVGSNPTVGSLSNSNKMNYLSKVPNKAARL
jgi:hypothetical protein